MTERPSGSTAIDARAFQVGPSALRWEEDALTIDVNETTAPIPARLRGKIRVWPAFIGVDEREIDDQGRHRWRPIGPSARVETAFDEPSFKWSGHGYFDSNTGDEPLERAFRYWDWSRAALANGETAILYNTDLWSGARRRIAFKLDATGASSDFEAPPEARLPPTPIWRIKRRTRADDDRGAAILRTLEDTPFYSRSILESRLFGERQIGVHESFSGARFRSSVVKAMLPFRMPRRPFALK